MLAIRMQRTGRSGHAMFRVIVQESRLTPTSGKVVATLGNYDPHAKQVTLDKEKVEFYLSHGAQPSDRIARLFKNEGVKLPDWVKVSADKQRAIRNPDKRRSTKPAEAVEEVEATVEPSAEATPLEASAEPTAVEDTPVVEDTAEAVETPTAEESADSAETADKAK